jgi:tetratricopeptide (TPR) repeat protein
MRFSKWLRGPDLNSIDGIQSIPVPKTKEKSSHDVKDRMEYILQRKATEHKKNGRMDLAIECLKKSNELMPYSFFEYARKDYERLVKYLKLAKRFDEARAEEKQLDKMFGKEQLSKSAESKFARQIFRNAKEIGTDLVEMSEHHPTCGECTKYQGRVFSISGKDKRFPKLPQYALSHGKLHQGCRHTFYPFTYGISNSAYGHDDIIAYSNRPFVDDRTPEEKLKYEAMIQAKEEEEKSRKEYDWICENLPDIAPKSFSGFRRMKNSDSTNFQKLCQAAHNAGYKKF